MRSVLEEAKSATKTPTRGIFFGCCASATAPPNSTVTTSATILTNFRLWILDFRSSDRRFGNRIRIPSCICLFLNRKSAIESLSRTAVRDLEFSCALLPTTYSSLLFDHPVCTPEHSLWNREANLLGGFEIDNQFERGRLLDGEICGLRTLKYFVYVGCCPSAQVDEARAVGHESSVFDKQVVVVYRRKPALQRQLYNLGSMRGEDRAIQHQDSVSATIGCGSEGGLKIFGIQYV